MLKLLKSGSFGAFLSKYDLIFLQFTLVIVAVTICGFLYGWLGVWSAFLGGMAWLIPSMYFVRKSHKAKQLLDAQEMLKSFFWSELVKMLLSFTMVIVVLLLFDVSKISFLSGFALTTMAPFLIFFLRGINK